MENSVVSRERLIQAGIAEIEANGLSGFSLRKVAQRCGVSCAAPYKHFKDKNALIQAIGQTYNDEWARRQRVVLDKAGDDVAQTLREVCKEYLRFLLDNPNYCALVTLNDASTGKWFLQSLLDGTTPSKKLVQQYCELYNLAFGGSTGFVPKNPSDYKGVSTDWYGELVHPALTHSHAVDLSGGTDKTNYSVGLSYFYQDGIMNYTKNDYNRLNFRARLDQTMSSWLKVGFNTVVSKWKANSPNSGVYYQAFVNPPVYGVYNDANTAAYPEKFDSPQLYGYANAYGNPVASAFYNRSWSDGLKTVLSVYAEATIIPDKLKFKTSYNLDFNFSDAKSYTPEHYVGGSQGTNVSSLNKTFSYGTYQIIDNTLTYSDSVGPHSFTAMLGDLGYENIEINFGDDGKVER